MRKVFFGLAVLLLAATVLQFFFAGFGSFNRQRTDSTYAIHQVIGMMVIPLLSILATLFAALSKAGGRLIGMAILPLGLVIVQVLIAMISRAIAGDATPTSTAALVVFGLHALNGLAIMGVAGSLMAASRRFAGIGSTESEAAAPAAT